jgi:hypothetical protein
MLDLELDFLNHQALAYLNSDAEWPDVKRRVNMHARSSVPALRELASRIEAELFVQIPVAAPGGVVRRSERLQARGGGKLAPGSLRK